MRWDAYIPKNQPNLQLQTFPMIYVQPADPLAFWTHMSQTKGVFLGRVSDTRSIYDNKEIPCEVQKIPVRPNFSAETGEIGIILWSIWYGYPPSLGSIKI